MDNKTVRLIAIIAIVIAISIVGYFVIPNEEGDSSGEYSLSVQGIEETHKLPLNKIPAKPNDPSLEGYVFIGWYLNEEKTEEYNFDTPIEPGTIVYAFFIAQEKESVSIIYESCGGSTINSRIIPYGDPFPMEYPSREGYLFVGWYLTEGLAAEADFNKTIDIEKPVNNSIRVYAGWTIDQSKWTKVIFDLGPRHDNFSINVMDGDIVSFPPIPSDDAMIFEGWYADSDYKVEWNPSTEIYKNNHPLGTVQIYAKWTSKAFTEYNPNIIKANEPVYLFEYTDYETGTVNHVYYIGLVQGMIIAPIWDFQQNIPSLELENKTVSVSKDTIENYTEKTVIHSIKTTYEPIGSSNVFKNSADVISSVGSTIGKTNPKVSATLAGVSGFMGLLGSFFNEEKVTTEEVNQTIVNYINRHTTTREYHIETSMKANFETVDYGKYIGYMVYSDVEFLQIESFDLDGNKVSSSVEYNIISDPQSKWFVSDNTNVFEGLIEAFELSNDDIQNDNQNYLQYLNGKGSGTYDDPILITSEEQFNTINWTDETNYVIVTNLDLSNESVTMMNSPVFKGHLDGCGHIIINRPSGSFSIYNPPNSEMGLFSEISRGSEIKNVNLVESTITTPIFPTFSNISVGALAGKNSGTISNIVVSNVSASIFGINNTFGGVVGVNDGDLKNINVYNIHSSMTGSNSSIGGIIGKNNKSITDCSATDIVLSGEGKIGGCVGWNTKEITNCTVTCTKWSYTTLTINGQSDNTEGCGGIVGFNQGELWNPSVNNIQIIVKETKNAISGDIVGTNDGGHITDPVGNGDTYTKPKKYTISFAGNTIWYINLGHTGRSLSYDPLILT